MSQKDGQLARVAILEEGGVIGAQAAQFTRQVIDQVADRGYADDALETFITHLAMAGQRALDGVEEEGYDSLILEELKAEEGYDRALELRDSMLCGCGIPFSPTEQEFLLVHILNLIG